MTPQIAGETCDRLDKALRGAEFNLGSVVDLICVVIRNEAWKERRIRTGEVIQCNSFAELLTAPPLRGYGEDPRRIEALLKDDAEALVLYRGAMNQRPGPKDHSVDNINRTTPKGTSKEYTLSRLKSQHPKLFEQVKVGKLSANAAAIKAGFRKSPSVLKQLEKLWKKATAAERRSFLKAIDID